MSPSADPLLEYILGWERHYALRAGIGLAGAVLLAWFGRTAWRRKLGVFGGAGSLLAGAALLVFALFPVWMIENVSSTPYLQRVRLIFGGVSLLVLLITLEGVRRTRLRERYALLWLGAATTIMLTALFPNAVTLLRAFTGMEYDTALAALVSIFLILVSFHFSLSFSTLIDDKTRLTQRLAILEEEVRFLRGQAEGDGIQFPKPSHQQDPS